MVERVFYLGGDKFSFTQENDTGLWLVYKNGNERLRKLEKLEGETITAFLSEVGFEKDDVCNQNKPIELLNTIRGVSGRPSKPEEEEAPHHIICSLVEVIQNALYLTLDAQKDDYYAKIEVDMSKGVYHEVAVLNQGRNG